jgi:carbamoyltransferase
MKILGISSHYHDSSAATIIDGKLIAAAAEERFTREKHDPSFPHLAIEFCLEQANLKPSDIDLIAYHEDPINKFSRNIMSTLVNWPHSRGNFIKAMKEMIVSGFWIRMQIAKKLDLPASKVIYIPHHMSHASHTFFTSPFKRAAILTLDAVGEWNSTGVFVGDKTVPEIKPLEVVRFPHSLGLVYSAFTSYLGFKVNSGESSVMALAAFGKPDYADIVREILKPVPNGSFEIDLSYFDFSKTDSTPVTEKFLKAFGEPRGFKKKISFDCLVDAEAGQAPVSADDQRYANIAASIQLVLEEVILHMVKRAKILTGADDLCLAGGVALNCVANSKIIESGIFKNVYCPPDPGDGGGAMGAGIYLAHKKGDTVSNAGFSPFFGAMTQSEELLEMLQHVDPSNWHRFSRIPLQPVKKEQIRTRKITDETELIKTVAGLIKDKKIIGWVQGRFENGPRALGARSILCDPSDLKLAKRLSTQVKLRAPFRPYACSMTEAQATQALEFFENRIPLLAQWMLCAVKVKTGFVSALRGAIHVDRTTRVQVVQPSVQPLFHKLLTEYGKISGCEALLNTSFNESGFPIVNTPVDALIMFSRTHLDVLVINNIIIERVTDAQT